MLAFSRFLSLLSLLKETINWLDCHGNRSNDVKHVEDSDKRTKIGVLWQVVQNYILDQVAISKVRECAHKCAKTYHDYMGDHRLAHHSSRFVLLRVDVQDTDVSFEDREHFAHERREHRSIEIYVVECSC